MSTIVVPIGHDADIVSARRKIRELASTLSFATSDLTLIATAVSELARNILVYATSGEIEASLVLRGRIRGIQIIARDEGPGIPDLGRAMQDGYSTGKSLGLGLPATKRIMDEFEIVSEIAKGTTITICKWAR